MLTGWPLAARAQQGFCGFNGVGDYICDKGGTPGGSTKPPPAPAAQPYEPSAYYLSGSQTGSGLADMIALSRTLQTSLAEAKAAAATAFAPSGENCAFVPDGSSAGPEIAGQTFTVSSSAELQAAIKKAKSGDAVVLKDGKYTGPIQTRTAGVTFMAENPHGATVTAPKSGQNMAVINHDGTVISGIVFEGNKKSRGLKVRASNALIQNNIIRDTINTALKVGDTKEYGTISNITITGNLIDGTGWDLFGEGMYIGTDPFHGLKNSKVEKIHIYNNVLRGFTENGIDIKPNVTNADIHHNILEDQVTMMERGRGKVVKHPSGGANRPGDKNFGPVVLSGVNANFHDNILRNMSANNTLLDIKQNAGNIVSGNSFNGSGALGQAVKAKGSGGGGQSKVTADNAFCNIGSSKTQTSGGLAVQASMNSSASACQSQEQRIMDEMKNLPSGGGTWDCSGGGDTATKQVAPGGVSQASAGGTAATPSPSQSSANNTQQNPPAPQTTAPPVSAAVPPPPASSMPVDTSCTVKAFPTAEGFGQNTKGGQGGKVIHVTNLNDSGTGSLRACVEASGPRTCVFDVSGTITLNRQLLVSNPYLTIAGQTAPAGGITLRINPSSTLGTMKISTHDVIVRHMRMRPGMGSLDPTPGESETLANIDALTIGSTTPNSVYNVVIDHSSFSWAQDENINVWYDTKDISFQWNIVSEALHCTPGASECHSKGILLGSDGSERISLHHNLMAHNVGRNPLIKTSGTVDIVNNVMHTPTEIVGGVYAEYGNFNSNWVGNYVQANQESGYGLWKLDSGSCGVHYYVQGNIDTRHRPTTSSPESDFVRPDNNGRSCVSSARYAAPQVTTTSAQQAFNDVLASAGATAPGRDAIDARVVSEVQNKQFRTVDTPSQVGGYLNIPSVSRPANYDTDGDGIADAWETAHCLNPNNASDGAQVSSNGYTHFENFINELAGDPVPACNGQPVYSGC